MKILENNTTVCFISTIPEKVREYLDEKLKNVKNLQIIYRKETSDADLLKLVPSADILIGWRPSKEILAIAKKLKIFINPGAGIHHLLQLFRDLNKKKEVILINGHGNSYFVAQHAVALLLSLMNKIIPHHQWMCQGKWRTGDEDGASIPLRFKNIGLLGYGAINQKVHRFLSGFDVDFFILRKHWEKQKSPLPTKVKRFEFSQLNQFLKEIDIVIIAVPVTPLTNKLITKKELKLLGPKTLLVNVSRGEIIDEESLFNSLKNNEIQGAAIDVWYNYNPKKIEDGRKYPFNFPFQELDNIILSPHRGYSPFADLSRWDEVIENIIRVLRGGQDLINVVNLEEGY